MKQSWIFFVAILTFIPTIYSCGKKEKLHETVALWKVEGVDVAAGVVAAEVIVSSDNEASDKGLKGAAVGRVAGVVRDMVADVPEAVIRLDLLMKTIQVGDVITMENGDRKVTAVLPLNGEGSLATVLRCKTVTLKEAPLP